MPARTVFFVFRAIDGGTGDARVMAGLAVELMVNGYVAYRLIRHWARKE